MTAPKCPTPITMHSEELSTIPTLVVTGPTASGKTALAVRLAALFSGEIISADSRQVYRGLDLGTGKDLEEYTYKGKQIPYHLIDIVNPMEDFDLYQFILKARETLADIHGRKKLPILCGGSPLYVHALLQGYDLQGGRHDLELQKQLEQHPLPELVEMIRREAPEDFLRRVDLTQSRRVIRALEIVRSKEPPLRTGPLKDVLVLAPGFPRPVLHRRIEERLRRRLDQGMLQEAERLHSEGMTWEKMEWLGLEYRFMARHLSGLLSYEEMFQQLLAHIRQFCKRQDIWFRKMEREGVRIQWIPEGDPDKAAELVRAWLNRN